MDFTAKIIEVDDTPPSANRLWRTTHKTGHSYLSKEALAFFELVKKAVGNTTLPRYWVYYKVEILIEPKQRRGDVDNRIKPVLDALTRSGIWDDDDRVAFVSCRFGKVNKRGRTVVKISPLFNKYQGDLN